MQDVTVNLLDWCEQNVFTLRHSLAKGTYGQIYLAQHNRSGNEFVVKAVHKHISRSQGESTPQEELLLHKYISKRMPDRLHVAKFIAGYEDEKYIYSVMEACRGPTLASLLDAAGGGIDEQAAALLLQKTATATMQLHMIGVLHRDIKPDNLMLVAPCGESPLHVICTSLQMPVPVTLIENYLIPLHVKAAPEVTNAGYYTTACDVWSLGILLYRMIFGREPFLSFREAADSRVPVQFPEDSHLYASRDAVDLMAWMLKHDFHARPSLRQVLAHPFTTSARDTIDDLVAQWLVARTAADSMSPVSSFALSPRGTEPVAIPMTKANVTMRITQHLQPSSSHGMLSAACSSHSRVPDYPELPSLTVPASIRRCQSPSGLEAQSRVHTLSAIADQTWREIEHNLAHRTAKQRERDQGCMSTVQEREPAHLRLASLQCVRLAEADVGVCSSPQAYSMPLQARPGLALHFQEDESPRAAASWHRNDLQCAALPHTRSQLSLGGAAISPDLLPASAGSDCGLGEPMPCSGDALMIPQMPVEAIGSWTQSGGCELQIGSAPTQSLAAHNDLIDATSLH